ncbi:MAG: DUF1624 domain-containing protein [Firmicutes bacterium]|nr:DUF1624 domain-containing protein [Bacillota bacterium]
MKERVYRADAKQAKLPGELKPRRYWELDFLRGLCVILMVIDHFCYSAYGVLPQVRDFFGNPGFWSGLSTAALVYWYNNARWIAHYVVISLFFILCGISCTLSHNNALRGLKALGAGLLITVATYLADRLIGTGVRIYFGVVHMLGSAMLLFALFDLAGFGLQKLAGLLFKGKRAAKTMTWVRRLLPCSIGVIGLIVFFAIPLGHFGKNPVSLWINGERLVTQPHTYLFMDYAYDGSAVAKAFLSIFLELKNGGIGGDDYFGLIPNALMVFVGSGIGTLLYGTRARNFLRPLDGKWNKPVNFVGHWALLVYLLHQVVIVVFFYAAGWVASL